MIETEERAILLYARLEGSLRVGHGGLALQQHCQEGGEGPATRREG